MQPKAMTEWPHRKRAAMDSSCGIARHLTASQQRLWLVTPLCILSLCLAVQLGSGPWSGLAAALNGRSLGLECEERGDEGEEARVRRSLLLTPAALSCPQTHALFSHALPTYPGLCSFSSFSSVSAFVAPFRQPLLRGSDLVGVRHLDDGASKLPPCCVALAPWNTELRGPGYLKHS